MTPVDLYRDIDRPAALLIGAAHDCARFATAVEAAGGRVVDGVGWSDVPEDSPAGLIVAALDDLGDGELESACARLFALVAATDGAMIVTLRAPQIDPAAGILLGSDVELLCEVDGGVLGATIAVALRRRVDTLADTVREGDSERLRRFSEEAAWVADLLAGSRAAPPRSPGVADRISGFGPPPRIGHPVRAADIRSAIRARRLRDQHFTAGLFEDPAWDMLLDLYAADLEGAKVSVSSLCIAAAVPPTTALRWIARMTEAGLFERRPDPFDRRRAYLGLTPEAHDRMDRHFAALVAAGLPIG